MPIRINLLAEEQAAEEMRRRDPVKRAIVYSGAAVVLVLVVWIALFVKGVGSKSTLGNKEAELKNLAPKELEILGDRGSIRDMEAKLTALNKLAGNRFLWGSPLDELQRCLAKDSTVQILAIRSTQTYQVTPATTVTQGGKKMTTPGAAKAINVVIIEARDNGNPVDQNYNLLRDAIMNRPYFKDHLKVNGVLLKDISAPQPEAGDPSKTFIRFVLELQYPEVIRS